MDIRYIEEPSLQFGNNEHLCPKAGILDFAPFDINGARHDKIMVGVIGKSEGISAILELLERCKNEIPAKAVKKGKKQNLNLFPAFPGFNQSIGFKCSISYDDSYLRKINNSDIEHVIKNTEDLEELIKAIAELYLDEIKYLSQNKTPDVILCVISEDLFLHLTENDTLKKKETDEDEDENNTNVQDKSADKEDDEEDELGELERNFRRHLKAKAMEHSVPIQLVRERLAKPTADMQDAATIAWNLFTAIYYKSGGTPWALIRKDMSETTCYAGISFYRSRDKKSIQTSIAQIFNEHGKGIILRGEDVTLEKDDRTPHLKSEQAFNLLDLSLREYMTAIKQPPKRLVIHKTSNFNDGEMEGFRQAAKKYHIDQIDMVTIDGYSNLRLYREKSYPPLRGTHISFTKKHHLLYTRGSVPYYETYTGLYIPRPLEIRLFEYDESPNIICDEVLALTKMNWNNTQFDRKLPITLECARNVGDILKYLEDGDKMQLRYSFYM